MTGDQIVDLAESFVIITGTWMLLVPVFFLPRTTRPRDHLIYPVPKDANVITQRHLVELLRSVFMNVVSWKAGIRHGGRWACALDDAQQIEILLRVVPQVLVQRGIDGENAD